MNYEYHNSDYFRPLGSVGRIKTVCPSPHIDEHIAFFRSRDPCFILFDNTTIYLIFLINNTSNIAKNAGSPKIQNQVDYNTASILKMSAFNRLKRIPIQYPFAFGIGISTVKTSLSDLLVQSVVEKKEEIDWKRNLAFASFGFAYLGGVQ